MNYEQKYKEAIEKARQFSEHPLQEDSSSIVEYIFPELADSEDERIRKALIRFHKSTIDVDGIKSEDIIAWLKKQGEQKTADKVEPKFKVGDWISGYYTNYKVTAINSKGYVVEDTDGNKINILFENEKFHHLFTIADAKNGDVLCDCHEAYDNPLIFILKKFEHVDFGLVRPSDYSSYCYLTAGDRQRFKEGTYHHKHNIKPATKEQRDLLFQKMKEAGYEWNAEMKELKKIEPIDEYEGLTDFERTVADICIGWIGKELGWKQYIKDNANVLLKIAIKKFNNGFAPVDDEELFFGDFRKTDSEDKGKAATANRQLYNRAILAILSNYVEKYPDTRFGQMLYNLGVNPHFDEESRETYCNLNETINNLL